MFINGEERLDPFRTAENKLPRLPERYCKPQRLAALVLYAVMVVAGIQVIPFAQPQVFPTMPIGPVRLYLPVVRRGAADCPDTRHPVALAQGRRHRKGDAMLTLFAVFFGLILIGVLVVVSSASAH